VIIIFKQTDGITITYINTTADKPFRAEFLVTGKYKNKNIDERIVIRTKDLFENKLIKPSNQISSYEFLSAIKKIKDNLNKPSIKLMMAEIAYKQKIIHDKEMEELLLMVELFEQKPKKNINFVTYNKYGQYVYYDKNF
jgi:hypothetical protein